MAQPLAPKFSVFKTLFLSDGVVRTLQLLGEFGHGITLLLLPLVAKFFLDIIVPYGALNLYLPLLYACIFLLVLMLILGSCLDYFETMLEEKAGLKLSVLLFDKLLVLSRLQNYQKYVQSISDSLEHDVQLASTLPNQLVRSTGHCFQLALICIILFYVDRNLSLIVFFGIPIYLLEKPLFTNQLKSLRHYAETHLDVLGSNSEHQSLDQLKQSLSNRLMLSIRLRFLSGIKAIGESIIVKVWVGLVSFFLGYKLVLGDTSLGQASFFFLNFVLIQSPLNHLRFSFRQIRGLHRSVDSIRKILNLTTATDNLSEAANNAVMIFPHHENTNSSKPAILPKAHLAIVDENKELSWEWIQTLIHQLPLEENLVFIHGTQAHKLSIRSLRSHFGILLDEMKVFNATLLKNLTTPKITPTSTEASLALAKVGLEKWLENLPQGLSTPLGDTGIKLDLSTEFRLNLAKILLQNPSIVIIKHDVSLEETDYKNMKGLLKEIAQDRMTIYLNPEIEVLRTCDTVLYFSAGRLSEFGKFDELVDRQGAFFHYYQEKFGNVRHFMEQLEREVTRCNRYQRDLCFGLFTVVGFDFLQDQYQQSALELCQNILNLLIKNVRVCDEVVCLKPGEFALLMPETNLEGGTIVIERVKKIIQSTPFHLEDHSLYLTLTSSHTHLLDLTEKSVEALLQAVRAKLSSQPINVYEVENRQ
ncbi:MAG: diguanylate cyclase [Deltaproteobacteria bacterium]|nr:diguanylate cyclase [Deltaproteobacteria bacterium]